MMKFMVLLLILAFAGLFFIKGPNGEPILKLEDLKPEVPEAVRELSDGASAGEPAQPTKVYKWRDKDGQLHFSNRAEDAEGAEIIEVKGDINIMPAVDPAVIARTQRQSASRPAQNQVSPASNSLPTSVNPESMQNMMQSVEGLQQQMEQKKIALDKISGS